ncbi:methyltransferase domain-containing protein [Hyphomicrobiales bacterium]|nr:methyltransferase domain-containing protein [Hyphomicrobiales bacterium]
MKKNIDNFKIFYSSFLGKAVSEILSKKISKLWNPIDKSRIAVIGFGSPYSESINKRIQRLFFLIPRHHGKYHFGLANKNLTASINEYALPVDDQSLDRLLVIHSFEYLTDHKKFLRESWRTLDKNGEILIIVPNSFGLWRTHYKNFFSSLRTFSVVELNSLLLNNFFIPVEFENSLFFPPINNSYLSKNMNHIERFGNKFFNFFSGVIIVKARKNYSAVVLNEKQNMKSKIIRNTKN